MLRREEGVVTPEISVASLTALATRLRSLDLHDAARLAEAERRRLEDVIELIRNSVSVSQFYVPTTAAEAWRALPEDRRRARLEDLLAGEEAALHSAAVWRHKAATETFTPTWPASCLRSAEGCEARAAEHRIMHDVLKEVAP